jgi:hypothetical protein
MKRTLFARLLGLGLLLAGMACMTTSADDDDTATDDDDTAADDDDTAADDDDTAADDDDTADDDDATSDCWQASTILDVSNAAGAGSGYAAPELSASCDGDELVVVGNGIPTYTFIPLTPNPLNEVNQNYSITLNPQIAAAPSDIPFLGLAGFAVNGMPWFGPNEGPQPDNFGDPIYNGITDGCFGHTANEYHHHALAQKCLVQAAVSSADPWTLADPDPTEASPIIGWALDGFPIYGPYGCTDASCATVIEFQSSWVQTGDPQELAWDNHEYQAQSGEQYLDRCNGRTQPDGSYGYHATASFPYILGCYMGTASTDAGGGGNRGGGAGDDDDGPPGGGPPSCIEESDCSGLCPAGSIGCTCHERPSGDSVCVPTCSSDADCAVASPLPLTCDEAQGICIPQ